MRSLTRWVSICALLGGALAASAAANDDTRPVVYSHTDHPDAQLGASLAIEGDRMVLGAPQANLVEVLERHEGRWLRTAILQSSAPNAKKFGISVALQGDTIAVGDPRKLDDGPGPPSVFEFDGLQWVEQVVPPPANELIYDLGVRVVLDQDQLIATSTAAQGAVVVYQRVAGEWIELDQLQPPDRGYLFGVSIDIDGDRMAVGDTAARLVELFTRSGGSWVHEDTIPDPQTSGSSYGWEVALRGDELYVANRSASTGRDALGAVHHFSRSQGSWVLEDTIAPEQGFHFFGSSLALTGDALVVGALRTDAQSGRALLYRRSAAGQPWELRRVIAPVTPQSGQHFSEALAIDGERVLLSSPSYDADSPEGSTDGALYSASHTELSLDASDSHPVGGEALSLESLGGAAGGLLALFIVRVDDLPLSQRLLLGSYDGEGAWSVSLTVPPGLSGLQADLRLFGMASTGSLAASNGLVLRFE